MGSGANIHPAGHRLIRELGRGGMGEVHEAWSERLGRTVALKLLRADLPPDPEALARLRQEIAATARVRHPNVVAVLDTGEDRGRPWVALELVQGGSLAERLRRDGPFTPEAAARIGRGLADALAAVHQAGVLHRDLKPSNVLLDPAGAPRLVDFGLASLADAARRLTVTGVVLGTPSYMAPEQVTGLREELDARTDVYGLGALLYELLTGRPPFVGAGPIAVYAAVAQDPPVPPGRLRPGLDPGLEALVLRCLEKAPAARPASAAELRDELESWLAQGSAPRSRGRLLGLAAGALVGLAALLLATRGPAAQGSAPAAVASAAPLESRAAPSPLAEARRAQAAGDLLATRLALVQAAGDPATRVEALLRLHELAIRADPRLLEERTAWLRQAIDAPRQEPWSTLARATWCLGDLPEGVARVTSRLALAHPDEAWVHLLAGLALDRPPISNEGLAIAALRSASQLEAPPLLASLALAQVTSRRGHDGATWREQYQLALAAVAPAARGARGEVLRERGFLLAQANDLTGASADAVALLELGGRWETAGHRLLASCLAGRGDRSGAFESLAAAVRAEGEPPLAPLALRLRLVEILDDHERAEEARELVRELLEEAPQDPRVRVAQAEARYSTFDPASSALEIDRTALVELDALGEAIPLAGRRWRSTLRRRLGDVAGADSDLERIIALDPLDTSALKYRYAMIRTRDPERALADLELLVQRDPEGLYFRMRRMVMLAPRDPARAVQDARRLLPFADLFGRSERFNLAAALANHGEPASGVAVLDQLLAEDPADAGALLERGRIVYFKLRRAEEGVRDVRRALELDLGPEPRARGLELLEHDRARPR